MSPEEWKLKQAKGGRSAGAEAKFRKLLVEPDRAMEIVRVIVSVCNESLTLEQAVVRLRPFCTRSEADVALLAQELRKLHSLSAIREERRVEHNTTRIIELAAGIYE